MMVFALTAALGLNINVVARVNSRAVRSFSRVVNPRMVELVEAGEFGTTDYSMTFKEGGDVVSPWHDMPLELDGGLYNMLTEIPKMTLKKMEVDTKAPGNPIKQDEKKGKARLYHGPIFWNYGCLPQTWEDPNHKGDDQVGGAFGDDDPVDVVEIGAASLDMGSFTPVKVLGCLSMIDDGEVRAQAPSVRPPLSPSLGGLATISDSATRAHDPHAPCPPSRPASHFLCAPGWRASLHPHPHGRRAQTAPMAPSTMRAHFLGAARSQPGARGDPRLTTRLSVCRPSSTVGLEGDCDQ